MASNKGTAIVIMGVSGSGKSFKSWERPLVKFDRGRLAPYTPLWWDPSPDPHIAGMLSCTGTIGGMLAKTINCCFVDADDYHPQSNKDKMKTGIPLTDEDRIPWLETLQDAIRVSLTYGETVILGCSALQKHYREILRHADPDYIPGSYVCNLKFILLSVGAEVLAARLEKRAADGNHFMPAKLLQSQLDSLQIDESEGIQKVDSSLDPQVTLETVLSLVQPSSLAHKLLIQ